MDRSIKVNNEITNKNMKELRESEDYKKATINRCLDEFEFIRKYIKKDNVILDIGVRDGSWLDVLKSNGYENLSGMDINEESIKECIEKGYNCILEDARYIKNEEEIYDLITILHTLEHLENPQLAIDNIYKILKKNGMVFVEVPLQKWEDPELWGQFNCFANENEVFNLFDSKKFRLIKIDKMDPPSKKPWFRCLFQKLENSND